MVRFLVVLTIGLIALGSLMRNRSGEETVRWSGPAPADGWVRLRNLNGSITVESSEGSQIEVTARKHWRGNRDAARLVSSTSGSDVYVCALYGRGGSCGSGGYESGKERHVHFFGIGRKRSSATMTFTVRVPKGVKVDANSVNGGITVRDASSEVIAQTVNGSIRASTSGGTIHAETVNGSIHANVDSLPATGNLELKTVNGSVVAELPSAFDAEVDLSTVHGRFTSDFEATVSGRLDPRHFHATIGKGGRQLRLETVNGSVALRKGS